MLHYVDKTDESITNWLPVLFKHLNLLKFFLSVQYHLDISPYTVSPKNDTTLIPWYFNDFGVNDKINDHKLLSRDRKVMKIKYTART